MFRYPSLFAESTGGGYVRPVVKIECGARSDRWPVAEQSMAAYVAEAYPQAFPDAVFTVPVLGIERTFWKRLPSCTPKPTGLADKAIPERFSRHYVDLAALAQHTSGPEALARDDLRARVVAHKQVFFPAAWANYETAVPRTLKLIPSAERLATLEDDYRAMQEMFFRSPPTGSEIVSVLKALKAHINGTSAKS